MGDVETTCPACKGERLKPESLAIRVSNRTIADVASWPITETLSFFLGLKLATRENLIAGRIIQGHFYH
jgi:excinuclease ABC subunit A